MANNENRSGASGTSSQRRSPARSNSRSRDAAKSARPTSKSNGNDNTSKQSRPAGKPKGNAPRGGQTAKSGASGNSSQGNRRSGSRNKPAAQKTSAPKTPAPKKTTKSGKSSGPALRMLPLGGMREIGKNMYVYECGNDMVIVDCGVAFPGEDQPGIDAVIPDMTYIEQNRDRLRGVFITHGHEDHIGALPWLMRITDAPVYGGRLAMELVRRKLDEKNNGNGKDRLHAVSDGDVMPAGDIRVEFIHVNHSIPDAFSLALFTPGGIAVHSGDFKIDFTPISVKPANLPRLAEIGSMGVQLLACESTNIESPGYSPSERSLGASFESIFDETIGRIFVASFSSNIFRVQQVVSAAERSGRKVALVGRSMLNVFDAAMSLGYIKIKSDTLIDIREIDRYDPDRLCIITTGSQGEPMSALTRMAFAEHRSVEIVAGDTVLLSADPIPGNEKSVYRVINELFKRGARVIYEGAEEDIHVSGHANLEEIKLYHQLVRPKYFLPIHGEYRHIYIHAQVAHDLGQSWDSMLLLNNGDIFECTDSGCVITGFISGEGILIDGSGSGDFDSVVLQERKMLADDGVVVVALAVDRKRNRMVGTPDIQMRGFIFESESEAVEKDCLQRVRQFARKIEETGKPLIPAIRGNQLRTQLRDLLYSRTRRRPTILLSLIELD